MQKILFQSVLSLLLLDVAHAQSLSSVNLEDGGALAGDAVIADSSDAPLDAQGSAMAVSLLATSQAVGTINGTKAGTPIDVITTASGRWTLDDLGALADIRAYRWTHDGSSNTRVMLCRAPLKVGPAAGAALVLETVSVSIGSGFTRTAAVAPGACRIVENGPLVEPNAAWLVQAVHDGRLPAYSRSRSWLPVSPQPIAPATAYDPSVLGIADGATGIATADSNFVGVTSSLGGEYESSRGFLHNIDARVVDLALNGYPFGDARTFERYTWESLAQPQGAAWSPVNHVTADPQFPLPGDKAYSVNLVNQVPPTGAYDMVPIQNWGRDLAHLEDTCYVHWIMSGDPVAAICLNRQLAFGLASQGYAYRSASTYSGLGGQERGVYNMITALWKSRDVALHMTSQNGKVLWDAARIEKMRADVFAEYDLRSNGQPTLANPSPWPGDTAARAAAGVVAHFSLYADQYPLFPALNGRYLASTSDFELVQYGKEPLYLWANAGDPTMRRWMTDSARELVARALLIGGSRGLDQCKDQTGSFMPLAETQLSGNQPVTATPPWTDTAGWANWVNTAICPGVTSTTYAGANLHTATELESALLMFRAAGVPGLDAALANITAVKAATDLKTMINQGLNKPKVWGGPL